MTFLQFIALAALAWLWLAAGMSVAWLIWRRTGNSGWVDATWTLTVGAAGLLAALSAALIVGPHLRQAVVAIFAALWAARLGTHIASRTTRITDDPRYAALIRNWGSDAGRQMFLLLQKQALVSIPLALAMLLAAWNPVPFRAGDVLAIIVLAIAIAGEGIADRQLARFRRDRGGQGEICDAGLWAWSRHPNYFFEWLGWVAYPILAIDLGGLHPYGWLALLGPAVMYWLLVHVSGIPPLEAHMVERHGERYRRYQARTSAFFPLPPAKGDR